MSTCSRLDLESLGSWRTVPKNFPGTDHDSARWLSMYIEQVIEVFLEWSDVAGSFSRSAVNYNAGVKTAMSNIVMSIVVLITLLALTPLFRYTPNCILSAVIIAAVTSLIDLKAAWLIWKIDKFDFLACLGAFLGVFFVSIEIGLLIAVSFLSQNLSLFEQDYRVIAVISSQSRWTNSPDYLIRPSSYDDSQPPRLW